MKQDGMANAKDVVVVEDPLLDKLQKKYTALRTGHLSALQKTLDAGHYLASKKMNRLLPSLDLVSDEIIVALNEIGELCEEYAVPKVGQLLKDVRAMMNQQLGEACTYMKEGYKSAFENMNFMAKETQLHIQAVQKPQSENIKVHNSPDEIQQFDEVRVEKNHRSKSKGQGTQHVMPKMFSVGDVLSSTTGFFAETLAVLLRCEVVRVYLYDEYGNLNCCSRFPFNSTKGDPMTGTHLELMLAKEIHQNVCHKCIAVNGKEPQHVTLSDQDRLAMEEELEKSGWKSMTSCLIFPILSSDGFRRPYGMIHAVNKQGISINRPGVFDEKDEVTMSVATRLFGCLLTRYPVQHFMHPIGQRIRQCIGCPLEENGNEHLVPLLVDEVEGAAEIGNKAAQMLTRLLLYRAPINAIYQTRSLRKNAHKLEVLQIVDKSLSTVEFNLAALEELWRVGHEENTQMYQHTQHLNEQVNFLRVLLRNVLDAIGASRTLTNMKEIVTYLQALELYAKRENISKITDLMSQTLLNSKFDGPIPPELKDSVAEPFSADERVRIERRMLQTPYKLKFGAPSTPNVRTYWCDPQKKRDQVRFFIELARKREMDASGESLKKQIARFRKDTVAKSVKQVGNVTSPLIHFGSSDYASKRPFRLEKS